MSHLLDLLQEVKDEHLSKEQLEDYYSKLSRVRADVKIELSGLTKEKGMFMLKRQELSVSQRKVNWFGSEKGQREIELKSYVSAMGDHLNSLKVRIYALL